jgi:hypothetical protein
MELSERFTAVETLHVLLDRGYTLAPKCRADIYEHRQGQHLLTLADKLLISGGPGPLDDDMREEVRAHQPELLAAAIVMTTPTDWLVHLVAGYRDGRVSLRALACNVAGFMGKDPIEDGRRLGVIIEEALR